MVTVDTSYPVIKASVKGFLYPSWVCIHHQIAKVVTEPAARMPLAVAVVAALVHSPSGNVKDDDIRIEFTGERPGQKLCNELRTLAKGTPPAPDETFRAYVSNVNPGLGLEAGSTALGRARRPWLRRAECLYSRKVLPK